jgi:hypothetical protein
MFFHLFTLCNAHVSALVIVLSDSLCESENGRLVQFLKRTYCWWNLAGASMKKTAILLGVLRATVSKVMLTYMNHGKTSVKRNSG